MAHTTDTVVPTESKIEAIAAEIEALVAAMVVVQKHIEAVEREIARQLN